jgi:hypothetical protein
MAAGERNVSANEPNVYRLKSWSCQQVSWMCQLVSQMCTVQVEELILPAGELKNSAGGLNMRLKSWQCQLKRVRCRAYSVSVFPKVFWELTSMEFSPYINPVFHRTIPLFFRGGIHRYLVNMVSFHVRNRNNNEETKNKSGQAFLH